MAIKARCMAAGALTAAAPAPPVVGLQMRVEVRARQELEEMLVRIEKHFKVRARPPEPPQASAS